MTCYCRGAAICEDCGGHRCTNRCICPEIDGAPLTQESVTTGWVPRTSGQELTR